MPIWYLGLLCPLNDFIPLHSNGIIIIERNYYKMAAQIIGYVVGGLISALAIFLIVKNTIDLIKAIKQRKEKKNEVEETQENKVSR